MFLVQSFAGPSDGEVTALFLHKRGNLYRYNGEISFMENLAAEVKWLTGA